MFAADFPEWLVRLAALSLGALFGSFFNVAIYRWPRDLSVVSPGSRCPSCGEPVKPWLNLPIVGWLMLRGKARCCGATLSPRYFLVEVLGAVLALAVAERYFIGAEYGTSAIRAGLDFALYFAFVGGMIVATFVDLEWMEIPDEVTLPLVAIGLVSAPYRTGEEALDLAVGAGAGFLIVQMVFVVSYEQLFGRRGMGEGDAKLLMAIGAFLGWKAVLFALVAGSFQGLIAAGISLATGKSFTPNPPYHERAGYEDYEDDEDEEDDEGEEGSPMKLPFGPFLALAAIEWLFFGPELLDRWFGLFESQLH